MFVLHLVLFFPPSPPLQLRSWSTRFQLCHPTSLTATRWDECWATATLQWCGNVWSTARDESTRWRSSTRANAEERYSKLQLRTAGDSQSMILFLYNTDFILRLFAGAHDSERGGHPAPGQASKCCPAHRGGRHVQRTIPGHGARQGELLLLCFMF